MSVRAIVGGIWALLVLAVFVLWGINIVQSIFTR
jgi:hypothetical protein